MYRSLFPRDVFGEVDRLQREMEWRSAAPQRSATQARSPGRARSGVPARPGLVTCNAWAKDRAEFHDLRTIVDSRDYRSATDVVRKADGFSRRDEFGDTTHPSDEMWEGFVDGAAALYNEIVDKL